MAVDSDSFRAPESAEERAALRKKCMRARFLQAVDATLECRGIQKSGKEAVIFLGQRDSVEAK